jgi:hypothetical protein
LLSIAPMLTAQSRLVLSLSIVLCSSAGAARAETPTSKTEAKAPVVAEQQSQKPDLLQRAREGLERYDLEGNSTFALLQTLGQLASRDPEPARALEARYLRAGAAADLIVISAKLDRPALLDSLAAALGYEPSKLIPSVRAELEAAAFGHYEAPARHALAMIQHVVSRTPFSVAQSVLRDFIAVEAAAKAAKSGDPNGSLAALADDSCSKRDGSKLAVHCALASFDSSSRRSLAALTNASSADDSLQKAAREGDPLAHALSALSTQYAGGLDKVAVCALPELSAEASAPFALPASLRRVEGSSTLTVRITPSEVRSMLAPCLGLRSERNAKPDEVALSWSKLILPTTYRPYVAPITGLNEMLTAQIEGTGLTRLVVLADDSVQAHVLARALVSLPAGSDVADVSLLTRNPKGELQARPIEIARSDASEPNLRVRVRLGGYSLYVGSHFEDIPRVKTDSGFTFDRAGLAQRLAAQQGSPVQISFMPEVTSQEIMAALSSTASTSQRVQVMIP